MNENQGDNQRFYNNFDSSNNYQQFDSLWDNNDGTNRTDMNFHPFLYDNEEKIQPDATATHTDTETNINYNNHFDGAYFGVPQNMNQLAVSPNGIQNQIGQTQVYPVRNMENIANAAVPTDGNNAFMGANPPIDASRANPYSFYFNPVLSNGPQQTSIPVLNPSTISFTKAPNGSVIIPNIGLSYPYPQDIAATMNGNNNMNLYPQFFPVNPNQNPAAAATNNQSTTQATPNQSSTTPTQSVTPATSTTTSSVPAAPNATMTGVAMAPAGNPPMQAVNSMMHTMNHMNMGMNNNYKNHNHNNNNNRNNNNNNNNNNQRQNNRNGDYKRIKNRPYMSDKRNNMSTDQRENSNPIDINTLNNGTDPRTTLMIRNVPNSFSSETLLKIIDGYVQNKYDFFYLPMDQRTGCNLGYAYINMVDIESVKLIYNNFHDKHWPNTKSQKTCIICYGRIQSTENNLTEYCKGWSVMISPEKYRPKFFKTVKKVVDGNELTTMEEFVPPISYDMK